DPRGRLPLGAGAGHVGATGAHHRGVRGPVRLPAGARASLRTDLRRVERRGQPGAAGGARMSITQDSPSPGSLDVIGRLSDHNRDDREERLAGTRGVRRVLRLVGPPFVVFVVFIGGWYLFRAF